VSSEDETFRRLKRATFDQCRIRLGNQTKEETLLGKWIEILNSMGWSQDEYTTKIKELFDRIQNAR
jgi:hypothetical protein